VPAVGVEPTRAFAQKLAGILRLPFPPRRHSCSICGPWQYMTRDPRSCFEPRTHRKNGSLLILHRNRPWRGKLPQYTDAAADPIHPPKCGPRGISQAPNRRSLQDPAARCTIGLGAIGYAGCTVPPAMSRPPPPIAAIYRPLSPACCAAWGWRFTNTIERVSRQSSLVNRHSAGSAGR